jgi:hypothetical protein
VKPALPRINKSLFASFSSEKEGLIPTVINNDRFKGGWYYYLYLPQHKTKKGKPEFALLLTCRCA